MMSVNIAVHRQCNGTTTSSSSSGFVFYLVRMIMLVLSCCIIQQQQQCTALPVGFVDEPITSINGPMSGTWAPNLRSKDGKPMLIIADERNIIYAIEDPDNPIKTLDTEIIIADLQNATCTNGPRGLFSILVHPEFSALQPYIFLFYTRQSTYNSNCDEDYITGPSNRLSRFRMNPETLQLDIRNEVVLLETAPTPAALHDGGSMRFGNDGYIYLATGDSAKKFFPSMMNNLFGKLLRVDIDGNAPDSNPYTKASGGKGVPCGKSQGVPPPGSPADAVCSEIYAYGFRNPFRMAVDINTKDKVRLHIGDVGESIWEEISEAGTDFVGKDYGWGIIEGPCIRGTTTDCSVSNLKANSVDPFYYYQHKIGEAVTASVFVPDGLWPEEYNYLFVEYVHGTIHTLQEDKLVGCRSCAPPRPSYSNFTFHKFERIVDMFFAPYYNTQALYYLSRAGGLNVRRIRYTGSTKELPTAVLFVAKKVYQVNEAISFIGGNSTDSDGNDVVGYRWSFGDNRTISDLKNPIITYSTNGEYNVQLTVFDRYNQSATASTIIVVGVPPTAILQRPRYGDVFVVGQEIFLSGRAFDSQNRTIPNNQIFWEVQQIHGNHFHPFFDLTEGNNLVLRAAPSPEDVLAASNSYLKVYMHAIDSDGLRKSTTRNIYPKKVLIDVDSEYQRGLKVMVNDYPVTTPATITTWVNQNITLSATNQELVNFTSVWSVVEGNSTNTIMTPTLTYKVVAPTNTNINNTRIIAYFTTPGVIPSRKVLINIDSKYRRGLKIMVNGSAVTTPTTITSWENQIITLSAMNQGMQEFTSVWDVIVGNNRQTITTPTLTYKVVAPINEDITTTRIIAYFRKR